MRTQTVRAATIVATLCLIQSCGGSSDGGTQPGGTSSGGMVLSLFPSTASARQNELTAIVASVVRTNGYAGPITFSVEGAPTGIAVVVGASSTIGASTGSTISLTPSLSVAAGTYNLTVRAKGTGITDATASLAFTVTGGQAQFTMVLLTPSLSIPAGGQDSSLTLVARNTGFTGAVTLSLLNPPAGITATSNPASLSNAVSQAWLRVNVASSVGPGSYPIVVRGSTTGLPDATATLQLQVTAGTASGNVTIDLSGCSPNRILWVAGQDGAGAWTRLTGASDLYRFNVTSGKGGFAWVSDLNGTKTLHVRMLTQTELTAAPFVLCQAQGTKIIRGTVAGLTSSEFAAITMGGFNSIGTAASPSYTLLAVRDGPRDLVSYRFAFPDVTTDRIIVRRDQNFATGASMPALDFASAEAVVAATSTVSVTGVLSSDALTFGTSYLTGATCDIAIFKIWALAQSSTATTRPVTVPGVPAAQQRATDFHEFLATTGSGSENPGSLMLGTQLFYAPLPAARTTRAFFHTLADRTAALGAPLATPPTVTRISGAYKRLQAVLTIPVDYTSNVTIDYGTGQSNPSVSFIASLGWLGTTAGAAAPVTVAVPDFSTVSGWDNGWAPGASETVSWSVTATGTNISNTQCVEGGFIKTARLVGSVN